MTDLLADAIWNAAIMHSGQTDKAGEPYIAHVCAFVAAVPTVEQKIVAALHDVWRAS